VLDTIAQHAKSHGLEPLKKLGQNFLFDFSLCERIARCAGEIEGRVILEIGPGPGGLTRAILAQNPKYLIVIERDPRCLNLLTEIKQAYPNLIIVPGDALQFNIKELLDKLPESSFSPKIKIIANLPYNITSPLLFHWFQELELIESITIMIQKEVAERLCAKARSKEYGRLTIICQLLCSITKQFDVNPAAFYPPPKVWSSVTNLIIKENRPNPAEVATLEQLTLNAFGMRRKMLKSSLKTIIPDLSNKLELVNLAPTLRAEDLTPEQYLQLTRLLLTA